MKIHRGIIKIAPSPSLSFSPIRADNKASAAFLIREWNGGVARERANERCESFISRVNASDALISVFDDIPFFSIRAGFVTRIARERCSCGLAASVGVLSDAFRSLYISVCIAGFRSRMRQFYVFTASRHRLFEQFSSGIAWHY